MHGFIFTEIQGYVTSKLGAAAWTAVLEKAGLRTKTYERFLEYPDEEAVGIVVTASEITGTPVPAILEDFGRYLGPHLLKVYRPLINPTWRTLDFLENTERTIHDVVRSRNRKAKPPELSWQRTAPDEATLEYRSGRKMCSLAKGIAQGVADDYGELVEIEEEECMHDGAERCLIKIRRLGLGGSSATSASA